MSVGAFQRFFQRHTLKTKLILAAVCIFVVGLWSLAFYATRMLRADIEALLGKEQYTTLSMVAAQVDREFGERLALLERVAGLASGPLREGSAAAQRFLDSREDLVVMFSGGAYLADTRGRAVADVPVESQRRGIDYGDRDYIARTLVSGKPTVGLPVVGRASGVPIIGIGAPVRGARGEVVGVLAGVVNLDLQNFLGEITDSRHGRNSGFLVIAPESRQIVAATDKRRILEVLPGPGVIPLADRFFDGYEGYGVTVNRHGVEMLVSSKRIPANGWIITMTLPTAEAFAPIRDMQRRTLVATLLLTLLAGLIITRLLNRQLAPLQEAAADLERIRGVDAPPQRLRVVRDDEIGQLLGAFNGLLDTLGQREALLKQILDTSSVGIFLVDRTGRISQANQRMAELFGYPVETLLTLDYPDLVHEDERAAARERMQGLMNDSSIASVESERLYQRAGGSSFWGRLNGRRFVDADGIEQGLVGVIADISVRRKAEEKLLLAASVFTHAREGILISDADGNIIDVNEAFTRITGYSREEVLGQNPRILKSEHHEPAFYAAMWRDLIEKGHWFGEIWNRRKDGEVYAELKTISAVRDETGVVRHYVALFSDITAVKEHEKQLERMAHFDVLTLLPNRVLLADRLQQAMALAHRHERRLAVAYLDLDGFKQINDAHGHRVGDQFLVAVAARMKQSLREGDTLARIGGDEFVAVLFDLTDITASAPLLNRLLAAAAQPSQIGDLRLQVSASVGVTFYPQAEEVDADQLLRQADQAMYQAKLSGKNRYHLFDAEQDRSVRGHHESLQRIRRALDVGEFVLHYQPKVNMRSGQVVGAEALIRWLHPERGLQSPASFLPFVEEHSLSVEIGEWVLRTALQQREAWTRAGLDIPVSVNIGARQLQQRDFALSLGQLVANYPNFKPGDLVLEVLETSALEDLEGVAHVIAECRRLGVLFALDDFGTGYSSLTYLKRLAADELKIDQSFVRDMLDDPDDLTILEGVLGMAAAFRRKVVAEGVETIEHGALLLQLGCEMAQGYGIARPMPGDDLPAWARTWRPDPAWRKLRPVSPDRLPVLLASAEHRAWVARVEDHLVGSGEPPALDPHHCGLGIWLAGEGRGLLEGNRVAGPLIERHEEIHALATELCALRAAGRPGEALQRRHELHALRDAIITELRKLLEGQP